jgi:hypothetical protein
LLKIAKIVDPKKIKKIIKLLEMHSSLSLNFLEDICLTLDRISQNKKIDLRSFSDVIIRNAELSKQGLDSKTFNAFLINNFDIEISGIQDFMKPTTITVPLAILREFDDRKIEYLKNHKLIQELNNLLINFEVSSSGLLLDFLEEETFPSSLRELIIKDLGIVYDTENYQLYRNNKELVLDSGDIKKILSTLIGCLGNNIATDKYVKNNLFSFIKDFGIKLAIIEYPHFKDLVNQIKEN